MPVSGRRRKKKRARRRPLLPQPKQRRRRRRRKQRRRRRTKTAKGRRMKKIRRRRTRRRRRRRRKTIRRRLLVSSHFSLLLRFSLQAAMSVFCNFQLYLSVSLYLLPPIVSKDLRNVFHLPDEFIFSDSAQLPLLQRHRARHRLPDQAAAP